MIISSSFRMNTLHYSLHLSAQTTKTAGVSTNYLLISGWGWMMGNKTSSSNGWWNAKILDTPSCRRSTSKCVSVWARVVELDPVLTTILLHLVSEYRPTDIPLSLPIASQLQNSLLNLRGTNEWMMMMICHCYGKRKQSGSECSAGVVGVGCEVICNIRKIRFIFLFK